MDAIEYCNWRSLKEDLKQVYQISTNHVTADWSKNGYRLPTEAEWEYAAREGGKTIRFGNGKSIADPQEINFDGRKLFQKDYSIVGFFRAKTVEVGSLTCPNEMGLHDMSGNVWEWCWDWYGEYSRKPQINPKGPDEGPFHVYRGGSWDVDASFTRVSYRPESLPAIDFFNIGFRIARSASF
jgi:formylglycine-generating enzyme required for sulfatase activity